MTNTRPPIDAYLKTVPQSQRDALEHIRHIVKQMVPEAEETISYGIPAFKYHGQYLVGWAAFKHHLSFFPTGGPIEVVKTKLVGFKLSKGTIQFTDDKPIPDAIIRELVTLRLRSIDT